MSARRFSFGTVALLGAAASSARAQDRLVGLRAFGAGVTAEAMTFGGGGLFQGAFGGEDSLRVRRAYQLTVPVTLAVPLGSAWTVDVTSVYAYGTVTFDPADPRKPGGRTATLAGTSDVRLRATGRVAGDALIVTLGANAPTGRAKLDAEQLTAVRVLAAPALGLSAPPVGAGASGTVGVLSARRAGRWAIAGGLSYELHDSYQPIRSLAVGAEGADFRPGGVTRVSIGADGLVGRERLSLSVAGDFFGSDRLRAGVVAPTSGQPVPTTPSAARVRLGPVISADAQLHLAAPRVREAVLWVSSRWRSSFARDGVSVSGSSGEYLDGGVRTSIPVTARTDVLLAVDGRYQSGLGFDDALLTASTTGAGLTAGVARRIGGVTVQPFARVQTGHVRSAAADRPGGSATVAGGSLGLTILSRF
jgi:hypothetical protein